MKKLFFAAIIWLMVPRSVYAQTQEFAFTKTGPAAGFLNPVVSRPHTYDSAPSAIQEGDEVKVWYCGGGIVGDPYHGHDSIYYASYNATTGAIITSPQRVVWPTLNDANDDGDMACAVTVVKHQNPNIANFSGVMGAPQYKMWYECAPRMYIKSTNPPQEQGCFTQICHAASDDGIHWRKWEALDAQGASWRFNQQSTTVENNSVRATAIITIPQKIKDNIGLVERGGDNKLYADFGNGIGCNDTNINYGVGHPSAVALQPQADGFQKIKLWYYDSQGDWNNRAVTYVESWDGFHFSAPTKTNIQSPNRIKYVNVPLAGHAGFYFSTTGGFDLNFFNYSWDGLNWFWKDAGYASFYTDYLAHYFNLRSITQCPGFGNSAVGNSYGWINSLTNIKVLTTEGGRGPSDGCNLESCACYNKEEDNTYCYDTNSFIPLNQPCNTRGSRGNSWDIYTLTGNLNFVGTTPTPIPQPGDLNTDGHVNIDDYNLLVANFGKTGTPGWIPADIVKNGKVDIFDYNILVGNWGR
jgi:hypothetical protein